MHFSSFSLEDRESLFTLFEVQEENLDLVDIFRYYLNDDHASLPGNLLQEANNPLYLRTMYATHLLDKYGSNSQEHFLRHVLVPTLSILEVDDYLHNPYASLLKGVHFSSPSWKLNSVSISPLEGFIYDDNTAKGAYFLQNPHFGFFLKDFSYPIIYQNNREWMSLKPNEINTMKTPLEHARGKVAIMGLGLGYFAYMASEKEEVTSIDIIEIDEEVITLFQKYLLPLFPHGEKIHLIHDDAMLFCGTLEDGVYDYLFIDLWHDVSDGLPLVLTLVHDLKDFRHTQVDYWVMESMITYFRMLVIRAINDEYHGYYDDGDYTPIQKSIQTHMKDVRFTCYQEVNDYLTSSSLFSLMISLSWR